MSDEIQKQEFLGALQALNETAGAWLDGDRDNPYIIGSHAMKVIEAVQFVSVPFENERRCENCVQSAHFSLGVGRCSKASSGHVCENWGLIWSGWEG